MKEEIFDQALNMMRKGSSKQEALLAFPKDQEELSPLLNVAEMFQALPKGEAPEPAMQRKYILAPAKALWLNWLPVSRFAGVSMSFLLLLALIGGTGYAALQSVPGQTLFSVKKTAEQVQLKFASSPQAKANLQLEITRKRLAEAEKVINNPSFGPKQEKAALNELLAQTSNTIETVNSAAKADPAPQKNHPIVASLEDITQQQQALLKTIKPSDNLNQDTKLALQATQQNATKISEIKRYIETASNEQSLAKLETDPNTVTISGLISQASKDKLVVEKTSFLLNDKTVIKDRDDNNVPSAALALRTKVSVVGHKENDKLVAQQVLILSQPQASEEGSVKGATTEDNSTSTPKSSSTTPTGIKKPEASETTTSPETVKPETDSSSVTGSFIFEDPSPQAAF